VITLSRTKGEGALEWEYHPWERAIAVLGEGGWELVSVQHANSAGDMGGGGEIDQTNAVAYFKRPVKPGRPINGAKPRLALTGGSARARIGTELLVVPES